MYPDPLGGIWMSINFGGIYYYDKDNNLYYQLTEGLDSHAKLIDVTPIETNENEFEKYNKLHIVN